MADSDGEHAALAERIYEAVKGFGTDEEAIYKALGEVQSPEAWRGVKAAFRDAHPDVDEGCLVAALREDLNDEEIEKVERALQEGAGTDLDGADLKAEAAVAEEKEGVAEEAETETDAAGEEVAPPEAVQEADDEAKRELAAVKIQSLQRGRRTRRVTEVRIQESRNKSRREAELKKLERKAEAEREERREREEAATKIQAMCRGRAVRKQRNTPSRPSISAPDANTASQREEGKPGFAQARRRKSSAKSAGSSISHYTDDRFDPKAPFRITEDMLDAFGKEDAARLHVERDEQIGRAVIDSKELQVGKYLASAKARAVVESDELRTRVLIEKRQELEYSDLDEKKRGLFLGEFSVLLLEHSLRLIVKREQRGRKDITQTQRIARGELRDRQVHETLRLQRVLMDRQRAAAWEEQLQVDLHGPDREKAEQRSLLFQRGKEEAARAREARKEARAQEKALRAQQIRQESQDIKRTTQRRREAEVELREEDIRRQKRGRGGTRSPGARLPGSPGAEEIDAACVGLLPSNHYRYAHAVPRGKHALAPLEQQMALRPSTRAGSPGRRGVSRDGRKRKPPHHLPRPMTSPDGDGSGQLALVKYNDSGDMGGTCTSDGSPAPRADLGVEERELVEAFYAARPLEPVEGGEDDPEVAAAAPTADIPHAADSPSDVAFSTPADTPDDALLSDFDVTQNTTAVAPRPAATATPEEHAANTRMVLDWNALASQFGNEGMFRESAAYLKKANVATLTGSDMEYASEGDRLRLRATTLNNIGCLHKRLKNYPKALSYLSVVSEIEEGIGELSPATLLNLSAVHAAMGHTSRALRCARKAMGLVRARLVAPQPLAEKRTAKLMAIITLHSLATCQATSRAECDVASSTYATALQMAQRELPPGHPATKAILTGMQEYDKLAAKRRTFFGSTNGSGNGRRAPSRRGGNLGRLPARDSPPPASELQAIQA